MQEFFVVQSVLVLASLGVWGAAGPAAALSYGLGSFLILMNVALLATLIQQILRKKLVALSLGLIVFKYAILGVILYYLLHLSWLLPLWFCAGLGTLMISAVVTSLFVSAGPAEIEKAEI